MSEHMKGFVMAMMNQGVAIPLPLPRYLNDEQMAGVREALRFRVKECQNAINFWSGV